MMSTPQTVSGNHTHDDYNTDDLAVSEMRPSWIILHHISSQTGVLPKGQTTAVHVLIYLPMRKTVRNMPNLETSKIYIRATIGNVLIPEPCVASFLSTAIIPYQNEHWTVLKCVVKVYLSSVVCLGRWLRSPTSFRLHLGWWWSLQTFAALTQSSQERDHVTRLCTATISVTQVHTALLKSDAVFFFPGVVQG